MRKITGRIDIQVVRKEKGSEQKRGEKGDVVESKRGEVVEKSAS